MMEIFPSKKDAWTGVLIWGIIVIMMGLVVLGVISGTWANVIFPLILVGMAVWMWFGTFYEMTEDALLIRSGPFRWRVPYEEIQEIKSTRSALSGPALSMDRLEITYGGKFILVSPQDKDQFITKLQSKTPLPKR